MVRLFVVWVLFFGLMNRVCLLGWVVMYYIVLVLV